MDPIIFSKLKENWHKKESDELMHKRRRRYLHFDEVLTYISPAVLKKVTDPTYVASHGFFPLLRFEQKNRVHSRDPKTKKKIIKTKIRPISYPSHFDAIIYSWYTAQLEHYFEPLLISNGLSDSVIAYRKLGKSNVDFAKEVFDFIKNKGFCAAISFDVQSFYDSLDFIILKEAWKKCLGASTLPSDHYAVYKSITRFSVVTEESLKELLSVGTKDYKKSKMFFNLDVLEKLRNLNGVNQIKKNTILGIPQGTPISCILSNIYMFDFDRVVNEHVLACGGLYRRYSDDIIVVCPIDKVDMFKKLITSEIQKLKLTIQDIKTEARFFELKDGRCICIDDRNKSSRLQYLGIEFDGLKTFLRHKGYARYERRMVQFVRREKKIAQKRGVDVAKRKIYESFSPLGESNYITYANKAAEKISSKQISRQVSSRRIMKKIKKQVKS